MDRIRASCGILGDTLGQLGGGFSSVGNMISGFAGAGVAGAAIAAVGEITRGLQWSVTQAAEAEQAIKNLSIAVEKSGTSWDAVKEGTLSALSELQRFTVYSDEQLAATLQRLLTFGMDYESAMKALGTATDLAAAKKMDLQSAADLVGKAFMGNTAILQRYGIDVTTSAEATAALKDAIGLIGDAIKLSGDSLSGFTGVLAEARVSLTDTEGKMRSTTEIAEELIGALQSGQLDAETFGQIMSALGISIDTAKLKAADFPGILASLNEQFGGTAQEQAKTYTGIQERFKNAVSDLGEKIGGILLPALSGVTEAMIPVVDWFGKGVEGIQAWLTEVGKMPEVQAATDAVSDAFQGLMKWFEDLGRTAAEILGPALQELWAAFKEIWDALAPIGEALGELWSIFSEGEGSGNILKDILGLVALNIKALALVIKEVAPYIKAFAQGFKDAADFIAPVLKQIVDAVAAFISALKTAFEGFYRWLIGASLWADLWNAVLDLTGRMVTQLLNDLASKFFEPMKQAFTAATQAVKQIWDSAWQGIQYVFNTVTGLIRAGWEQWFAAFQTAITNTMQAAQTIWSNAWQAMQALFANISEAIRAAWQAWLNAMHSAITSFWSTVQSVTSGALSVLQSLFSSGMGAVQGILNSAIGAMQGAWNAFMGFMQSAVASFQATISGAHAFLTSVLGSMQSTASSALSSIASAISSAWEWITSSTEAMADQLTKHSIWPDMLESMQQQTEQSLAHIVGDFERAFGDIGIGIPAVTAGAPERAAISVPTAATPTQIMLTIPITVTLDGQTISRHVEQRLVESVNYRWKKVA